MSKPLKPKRGTTAEHAAFIGQAHEVTYDTDKQTLVCHDGLTAGGFPLARADEVAQKDAAQDAAIAEAQSSADEKIVSLDIDGLDLVITYGNGTVERVKLPAGKSVGDMWWGIDPNSKPANVQVYSGQLLSRSAYPDHWGLVNGQRTVVSESEWQSMVSSQGFCPFYSSGDGSTTYRMPMVKGVHPKFVAALAEAGGYTAAGLPNATGTFTGMAQNASGAFYNGGGYTAEDPGNGGTSANHAKWTMDLSRSNAIYGASNTVQPPAVNVILGEYVVGTVAVVGEADAESLLASVTQLEVGKAETDLSNLSTAGRSLAAGLAFPGFKIDSLTLGAHGSKYTAPADGWFVLYAHSLSASAAACALFGTVAFSRSYCYTSGAQPAVYVPVRKDDTCVVYYSNIKTSEASFRFVYARGAE